MHTREREKGVILYSHCYHTSHDYLIECFIPDGCSKACAFKWQRSLLELTLSLLIDLHTQSTGNYNTRHLAHNSGPHPSPSIIHSPLFFDPRE